MPAKRKPKKRKPAIDELIEVMARLRGPGGCPWERDQDHMSIRFHAVEEVMKMRLADGYVEGSERDAW